MSRCAIKFNCNKGYESKIVSRARLIFDNALSSPTETVGGEEGCQGAPLWEKWHGSEFISASGVPGLFHGVYPDIFGVDGVEVACLKLTKAHCDRLQRENAPVASSSPTPPSTLVPAEDGEGEGDTLAFTRSDSCAFTAGRASDLTTLRHGPAEKMSLDDFRSSHLNRNSGTGEVCDDEDDTIVATGGADGPRKKRRTVGEADGLFTGTDAIVDPILEASDASDIEAVTFGGLSKMDSYDGGDPPGANPAALFVRQTWSRLSVQLAGILNSSTEFGAGVLIDDGVIQCRKVDKTVAMCKGHAYEKLTMEKVNEVTNLGFACGDGVYQRGEWFRASPDGLATCKTNASVLGVETPVRIGLEIKNLSSPLRPGDNPLRPYYYIQILFVMFVLRLDVMYLAVSYFPSEDFNRARSEESRAKGNNRIYGDMGEETLDIFEILRCEDDISIMLSYICLIVAGALMCAEGELSPGEFIDHLINLKDDHAPANILKFKPVTHFPPCFLVVPETDADARRIEVRPGEKSTDPTGVAFSVFTAGVGSGGFLPVDAEMARHPDVACAGIAGARHDRPVESGVLPGVSISP